MQMDAVTRQPHYVSKYVGTTLTGNGEITLTAKWRFLFNKGFESEYAEWEKVESIVFDRHSFKVEGDTLYVEDLRDDIVGHEDKYAKIN
jgi:hypothetical protein